MIYVWYGNFYCDLDVEGVWFVGVGVDVDFVGDGDFGG